MTQPVNNLSTPLICPVCLAEIETADKKTQLVCKHIFHENCVAIWLKRNPTCPACRDPVPSNVNRPHWQCWAYENRECNCVALLALIALAITIVTVATH